MKRRSSDESSDWYDSYVGSGSRKRADFEMVQRRKAEDRQQMLGGGGGGNGTAKRAAACGAGASGGAGRGAQPIGVVKFADVLRDLWPDEPVEPSGTSFSAAACEDGVDIIGDNADSPSLIVEVCADGGSIIGDGAAPSGLCVGACADGVGIIGDDASASGAAACAEGVGIVGDAPSSDASVAACAGGVAIISDASASDDDAELIGRGSSIVGNDAAVAAAGAAAAAANPGEYVGTAFERRDRLCALATWGHLTRFRDCMEASLEYGGITWHLQAASERDPLGHALDVLNRRLSYGYRRFKFGVSYLPANRWRRSAEWEGRPLIEMAMVFVSENSDDTANLETQLVAEFRGDSRMLNWRKGGEKAHHGISPHFVYIMLQYRA